jgi:hypothetical protein
MTTWFQKVNESTTYGASLSAWVLHFGYSLRDELPLEYPEDSMDSPAGVAASTKCMTIGD